jgi:hypothetical protein
MKKFFKRTFMLFGFLIIVGFVVGLLNKPSDKDALEAGFASVEEFDKYQSYGYSTMAQFKNTGFADLQQSIEYKSAGFSTLAEFQASGFSSIQEAKPYKNAGFDSKAQFSQSGFLSLEEGKNYTGEGFPTKQAFIDSGFIDLEQAKLLKKYGDTLASAIAAGSAISLKKFKECDKSGASMYENECYGKNVIWYAKIDRHADDGVYLDVVESCDENGESSKAVWSRELSYDFWKKNDDACIQIKAEIRDENFMTPTIVVDEVLWIESKQKKLERIDAAKKLAEEERIRKEKQKLAELEQNKFNPEWLSDNFSIEGGVLCKPYVEKLAKHTYRWTDGWLGTKFPSYLVSNEGEPFVLTMVGDKIEFQNGFGAWSKTEYFCSYNVKTKKVLNVWAN